MPSEANDIPTTPPRASLQAADALADLGAGIDALMYLSVSEHFEAPVQSALGFIHRALSDKCAEATRLVDDARNQAKAGSAS